MENDLGASIFQFLPLRKKVNVITEKPQNRDSSPEVFEEVDLGRFLMLFETRIFLELLLGKLLTLA
jgi:hypothetical protein